MSNRVFLIFILVLFLLGFFLGWFLASRPSFSIPPLLNVTGIIYNILAVVLLYEAVAEDEKNKRTIVNYVAPFLLWAQTVIPLGITISWFWIKNLPHGNEVSTFGFAFFAYFILPLSFVDATVTFPRFEKFKSLHGRYRRFGLFLLLSGLGMQLIAGLMAL
ncbi:MAG: hypothetical protein KGI13_07750 [Betaproteobacteria bacterium]|nr:hypothetical protein [Betaproteobacteria bacterium]